MQHKRKLYNESRIAVVYLLVTDLNWIWSLLSVTVFLAFFEVCGRGFSAVNLLPFMVLPSGYNFMFPVTVPSLVGGCKPSFLLDHFLLAQMCVSPGCALSFTLFWSTTW